MERAVLDWQDLSIAGFADGTYVQLSVADWLRLGGNVERAVAPPELDNRSLEEALPNTPTPIPQVERRWKLKKGLRLRHWQCAFRSRGAAHRRTQPRTQPEQIGFHRLYNRSWRSRSSPLLCRAPDRPHCHHHYHYYHHYHYHHHYHYYHYYHYYHWYHY